MKKAFIIVDEVMNVAENTNYHYDKCFFNTPRKFGDVLLYQIGRLYSTPTTRVGDHLHGDLYELTVVTDGCGVISTNGVPRSVKRGDIYISFPCDTHRIESDYEKPLKYDFFAFNTTDPQIKRELEAIILDRSSADQRVFCDERISFLVSNAIFEFHGERFAADKLLADVFSQIVIYTVRNLTERSDAPRDEKISDSIALCYRMMNYIDTHIYSMKKLEELGRVMGYSYGYLSSLYKKTTSNTLAEYYRNKRLEMAKMLVLENKMRIGEIGEMLNYTSVYAFSKAFKNRFGVSPENLLKQKG